MASAGVAAFVLAFVGGILALVQVVRPLARGFDVLGPDALLLLAGGALAVAGAVRGRGGSDARGAGVLAVVGGALILLEGEDLAGALALAGGVLHLV